MVTVTPHQRKWLAHLDAGRHIYRSPITGHFHATGEYSDAITARMVAGLVKRGYIEAPSKTCPQYRMTERGRLALIASNVKPGQLRILRKAVDRDRSQYPVFDLGLYKAGLVDDFLNATDLGRQVLNFIDGGTQ